MTLSQLVAATTALLTRSGSNRVSAAEILESVLNVISYFATEISDIIPAWDDELTFQTDGSDDGTYCIYPDTNGKKRIFETLVDDNTNHLPPSNPAISENAYWIEVSASPGAAIPEWAAGLYGPGLVIVYHNHTTDGKGLYILLEPARPYVSENIETEITGGDWERLSPRSSGVQTDCGMHDASTTNFPSTGGTLADGSPAKANYYKVNVAGIIGGVFHPVGTILLAFQDNPTDDYEITGWKAF